MSSCDCQQCRDVIRAEMLNEVPMLMWIDSDGFHMERMKLHDRDKGLRDFEAWLDDVRAETFDEGVEARRKYDYPENPYREETE